MLNYYIICFSVFIFVDINIYMSNSNLVTKRYKIWCETENRFVETGWISSKPATCPNGVDHEILNASVISGQERGLVEIKQEIGGSSTKRSFREITRSMTVPERSTRTDKFYFPYNISVLAGKIITSDTQKGDVINIYLQPNTPNSIIGAINNHAENIIDFITIPVTNTVLSNIEIGNHIQVVQTNNSSPTGTVIRSSNVVVVTDIDFPNHSIQVNNNDFITQTTVNTGLNLTGFDFAYPLWIVPRYYYVQNIVLSYGGEYKVGDIATGSSYLPKHTWINFEYTNNGIRAIQVSYHIPYYY